MAKKIKTYEENIEEFVTQLKNAGVKEKTIQLVLNDINEHQEKELERQLKEMQKRMYEVLKEAYERDENI